MRPCRDIAKLLSAFLDGELAPDDREYVDDHVRGCAQCALRCDLLRAQGQALRERMAEAAAGVDFEAMTRGILARVSHDRPLRGLPRLRVLGEELWRGHRRSFAAAGGLALAASVALVVALAPPKPLPEGRVAVAQIDELDFGSHDGAVLELPHDTTVIWLSEED